jgi:hypothetical protein
MRVLHGITLVDKDGKCKSIALSNIARVSSFNRKSKVDSYENFYYTPQKESFDGKINLRDQFSFSHHRSGWKYVLKILSFEHRNNATKFDGFLDSTFGNLREQNIKLRNIPYREDWIGIFHNPPCTPSFFVDGASPTSMIFSKAFQDSIPTCKGLYTLSEYHANLIRILIPNISVEVMYLPTENPIKIFNFDNFIKEPNKKLVNIGWWLRKLTSIYRIKVDENIYQKLRLLPSSTNQSTSTIDRIIEIEKNCFTPVSTKEFQSVINMKYLLVKDYDNLLTNSIVFVDMYDTSANNAVVECIVRATPILINRLPALVEYLGSDYPFYFDTLEEASKKLENNDLIQETHKYLLSLPWKEHFTSEYFLNTFKNGKIYKSL